MQEPAYLPPPPPQKKKKKKKNPTTNNNNSKTNDHPSNRDFWSNYFVQIFNILWRAEEFSAVWSWWPQIKENREMASCPCLFCSLSENVIL